MYKLPPKPRQLGRELIKPDQKGLACRAIEHDAVGSTSAGFASPRSAAQAVWMWSIVVHLPSSGSLLETAKAEFKSAWL
jgi:hypothetical protein